MWEAYDNTSPSSFPTCLHLWLLGLGIDISFTRKRCPSDHAKIERTHQTMTLQALLDRRWPLLDRRYGLTWMHVEPYSINISRAESSRARLPYEPIQRPCTQEAWRQLEYTHALTGCHKQHKVAGRAFSVAHAKTTLE
jgi:transposase InsO family protein